MSGNLALNVCSRNIIKWKNQVYSTGVLYCVQVFVYCFMFHIEFCQTPFIDGVDDTHSFSNIK